VVVTFFETEHIPEQRSLTDHEKERHDQLKISDFERKTNNINGLRKMRDFDQ
jgi:hypothetical protein